MENLRDRLRQRMDEKGLTVRDLVSRGVLSRAGVYNILNGTADPALLKSKTVDKLARALGVEREWLVAGKGVKSASDPAPLSTGMSPAAAQSMRPTGRTLAIAAGALTRFLARRNMTLDVTDERDAELLLAVEAEYLASRSDSDADTAFVIAIGDLIQTFEAKRERHGIGSEPGDRPARRKAS